MSIVSKSESSRSGMEQTGKICPLALLKAFRLNRYRGTANGALADQRGGPGLLRIKATK